MYQRKLNHHSFVQCSPNWERTMKHMLCPEVLKLIRIWIFTDSGFVNDSNVDFKIFLWHNWLIFSWKNHLILVALRLKIRPAVIFEFAQLKTSRGIWVCDESAPSMTVSFLFRSGRPYNNSYLSFMIYGFSLLFFPLKSNHCYLPYCVKSSRSARGTGRENQRSDSVWSGVLPYRGDI